MKKVLSILFVMLVAISLCACSAKQEAVEPKQEESIGMKNPMVEYKSLDEINAKVGSNLIKPGVMGVSDEKFFVVDENLADYRFTLNGLEYSFRASKDLNQDISGIYVDGKSMFENGTNSTYSDSQYHGFNFVVDDVQYTFTVKDNGQLDDEQFANITDEIFNTVCMDVSDSAVNSLIGEYMDSYSQRAKANISFAGKNMVLINISWSNSVNNADEWTIIATYNNGKLEYGMGDITHLNVTYKEDGSVDNTLTANDAIPGYFEVIDEKVCWTGSGVETTANCVFEK